MKKRKFGNILAKEIKKITERYPYFDFSLEQDIISKAVLKKDTFTPKTKWYNSYHYCNFASVFVIRLLAYINT